MLGCQTTLVELFSLSVDIYWRSLAYVKRASLFCRSLVFFSVLSILVYPNTVFAAKSLPITKQLPVSNIFLDSYGLSNIQVAVHFRPGGVDQNQRGDTDS